MKLCILLHFYQPYNQQDDILLRIVNECYLPVTRGLKQLHNAKVVINISGCLTELLAKKGYNEVLENLKQLAADGKVEFTGSAKYHAILPLLPKDEVIRQIRINDEVNLKYFGGVYNPTGFFPPEMAVTPELLDTINTQGFKWAAVPQLSHPTGNPDISKMYISNATKLIFRNKRVSSLILSAVCRTAADLKNEIQDLCDSNRDKYIFVVMDAETFGHHRIGHEKMLFDLLDSADFSPVLASDLVNESQRVTEQVIIRPCTWTNQEQDFWLDDTRATETSAKTFVLWQDPQNPIHKYQWELTYLVLNELQSTSDKSTIAWLKARELLDKAIASDQFWWASAKPWWSLEMIEQGAHELNSVLVTLGNNLQGMKKAEMLYRKILDKAFEWQRTGYIRKKYLDNSGTFMQPALKDRTSAEWFNQLVLEFECEMNEATKRQDFEKAIKWRDAVLKISLGSDMYDVLHVVDELWLCRNLNWGTTKVKPFLQHSWSEFSDFAKKHFLNVKTEEDFEEWKKNAPNLL